MECGHCALWRVFFITEARYSTHTRCGFSVEFGGKMIKRENQEVTQTSKKYVGKDDYVVVLRYFFLRLHHQRNESFIRH